MKYLCIFGVLLLAGCGARTAERSIATASDGVSILFLECFGWCSVSEGDGMGQVAIDRAQDKAPFE